MDKGAAVRGKGTQWVLGKVRSVLTSDLQSDGRQVGWLVGSRPPRPHRPGPEPAGSWEQD